MSDDKYGIKKIYPDAQQNPEHQYLDMDDIKEGRVDDYPDTYEKSDEKVPGKGDLKAVKIGGDQVRLALYSSNGNPFGSLEHTVYFKFDENTNVNSDDRLFQPYTGGGDHHTDDRCCEGNAMKVAIHANGDIKFRKEICHGAYCGDRRDDWHGPPKNMKNGGMVGRWWGFKQIEKHLDNKNRQEVWMDEGAEDEEGKLVLEGNQDRWRLIATYEDKRTGEEDDRPIGDWTSDDYSKCTGCPEESRSGKALPNGYVRLEPFWITHKKHENLKDLEKTNCVVLRIDEKKMKIAYWSSRKIEP